MKNRVKALLLATGLTLGMLGMSASAESSSEGAVEALTEAAADLAAQTPEAVEGEGTYAAIYDQAKASVGPLLETLSAMTDEQLEDYVTGTDASSAKIAATWMGVKEELGTFVGVREQEVVEEGSLLTINNVVDYDAVPENTVVNVAYAVDMKTGSTSVDWDIKYPMSKLIREAGLNTLLGLGTVFVVLVFLSFVIGNIHWIPDLVDKMKKKPAQEVKSAPAPAAPAPEPVAEEELTDDEELVAVIAAAIAAAEETSVDGFVVRSIRKANRRNWLGA